MQIAIRIIAALAVGAAILAAWGYANARADPIVRRASFALPGWPTDAAPVRVALVSDIHIGNMTMDGARLTRIVGQINALKPDLVVLAGDFIAGHDKGTADTLAPALTAPLAGLKSAFGTISVLGNHDHWTGAAETRQALERAGIRVLENDAAQTGPIAMLGIGDVYTNHADAPLADAAAVGLTGAHVVVSHGPDIMPMLGHDPALVLAGHTHCGQIVLPIIGPPVVPTKSGTRYLCGIVREGNRAVVVTAGVGTSVLPFRFGAPPDLWLLTLGPGGTR